MSRPTATRQHMFWDKGSASGKCEGKNKELAHAPTGNQKPTKSSGKPVPPRA